MASVHTLAALLQKAVQALLFFQKASPAPVLAWVHYSSVLKLEQHI